MRGPDGCTRQVRRRDRLPPEMQFDDRYLSLDYIGHVPIALLFFHATEADLIEHILGDAGHFNPFTTLIITFRDGMPAPFRCTYADADGRRQVLQKPHLEAGAPFGRTFAHRALEWVGPPVNEATWPVRR